MSYEQKDNDLVLFKNDKKESDKHPDYKGSGRVNGVDVWLSAWINKSKDGKTYMSLKTQNKEEAAKAGVAQARRAASPEPSENLSAEFFDDIPFSNYEYRGFA